MTVKIAILGGGPVAAFVYRACRDFKIPNSDILIYTQAIIQEISGAAWFRSMPKLPGDIQPEPVSIHVFGVGDSEEYFNKQWTSRSKIKNRSSSFPEIAYVSEGYNPRECLRPMLKDANVVITQKLRDWQMKEIAEESTLVFQTFPTKEASLKSNYVSRPVIIFPNYAYPNHCWVMYNGMKGPMVRISSLFGYIYVEYVSKHSLNYRAVGFSNRLTYFNDLHPDVSPISPYNGLENNVILIGRYATCDRKMLAHEAYGKTTELLGKHL